MSIVQIPKAVDIPTNAAAGVSKGKQTSRGRQRIEIKTIREKNKKHVTFSKRRKGLFKKASELCVLCGADVAVITFSEAGKAFSFGHPNADSVIARYLHGTSSSASSSSSPSDPMSSATAGDYALMLHKYNEDYEHLKWEIKRTTPPAPVPTGQTNDNSNSGDEINNNSSLIWWDQPVDGLELHELEQYAVSLDELRNKIASRAEELGLSNGQRISITGENSNGDCNRICNCSNDDNDTAKVEVQDNAKEYVDYSQIFENDGGLSFMNHHLTGTMDAASANGFGVPHDLFPLQYNSAARG